ncbi:MAG: CRTAC1 family protein [Chloroflexota bacterium]
MFKKLSFVIILLVCISSIISAQQSISLETQAHAESVCSDTFIEHELDHITNVDEMPVRMFESNGSGLAINDLNNDGLLDIVMGNLDGDNTVLWNEGDLTFRPQALDMPGKTRSVAIIDLDADGWQDIVITTQRGAPSYWQNQTDGTFQLVGLTGVTHPAYAMNWADLDKDGDLDLVAASYDAEMERIDASYLLNGGAGIYYYENLGDFQFSATRLADWSQALAIYFPDMNNDGQWDIAVGNDFAEPDRYWVRENDSWVEQFPFGVITHSTMSFAGADIENDGSVELYATDMHPYSDDEETVLAWQPVMEDMMAMPMPEDDPQDMVNVMQTLEGDSYINIAQSLGVDYTGWSWSAKFGDLNSDGFQDLYVVNGMIAQDLFGHLPDNELVEENQAFMNQNGENYIVMPEWNLNALYSGRGMSMADLDNDGDLDVVVNNLLSNAMLYENQLCGGDNLTVDLLDPATANLHAIGSHVLLHTSDGIYRRDVYASSGYLSGDATALHFGIPVGASIEQLEIIWSDSTQTLVDELEVNTHIIIRRDT